MNLLLEVLHDLRHRLVQVKRELDWVSLGLSQTLGGILVLLLHSALPRDVLRIAGICFVHFRGPRVGCKAVHALERVVLLYDADDVVLVVIDNLIEQV